MTVFKNAAAAVMALSLVAMPTLAQAATAASKLSVAQNAPAARVGASTAKESNSLVGGALIALLAGAAAIAAIVVIAEEDDSDSN